MRWGEYVKLTYITSSEDTLCRTEFLKIYYKNLNLFIQKKKKKKNLLIAVYSEMNFSYQEGLLLLARSND